MTRKARKRTAAIWPQCPLCNRCLGFAYYATAKVGYEFCSGCNYRQEVDWIEPVLLAGLRKVQSQGLKEPKE